MLYRDIIKSTAIFVARNGQKFLVELSKREKNNPQFDFLNPAHCLFGYFTSLTESYTKCLLPTKPQIEKLNTIAKDRMSYLRLCQKRADWDAHQQAKIASEEMRKAEERMEMQSIDWHTFFIAETITFEEVCLCKVTKKYVVLQNKEDLPKPIDFTHPRAALVLMTRNPKSIASAKKTAEQLRSTIPEDADQIDPDQPVIVEAATEEPTPPVPEETDTTVPSEGAAVTSNFSDAPENYKRRVARDNDVSIVQVTKNCRRRGETLIYSPYIKTCRTATRSSRSKNRTLVRLRHKMQLRCKSVQSQDKWCPPAICLHI